MKTLLIRAVSALIAVFFICLLIYFRGADGMRLLCVIAVLLSIPEGQRILFPGLTDRVLQVIFIGSSLMVFALGIWKFEYLALIFAVTVIQLIAWTLLLLKRFPNLNEAAHFQGRALIGLFYLGLFPVFAVKTLDLENGMLWFLAMLMFVFASDTFAYLAGWTMGKHLLLPAVSPKKTVEGSVAGLLGSLVAAVIMTNFLPHIPLIWLMSLALIAALVGQFGDLFESMLKRVANTKDSGSFMPGHGGVLDRIDGILFAAPCLWFGASLLEKWF